MKKGVWIGSATLAFLIGYFIYGNPTGFQRLVRDKLGIPAYAEEIDEDERRANEAYQRFLEAEKRHLRFAGQGAALLKGRLLDESYREPYEKIVDTLELGFGADLYFLEASAASPYEPNARFAFRQQHEVDTLTTNPQAEGHELRNMLDRLIYEGKVEGYRIAPDKFASSTYVYPYDSFANKYGNHFVGSVDFEQLDYEIKEALLDFFNSEEGTDFGYPDDQRTYRQLIHMDHYTGTGKPELAVVLCDKERAKTNATKEVLLVVAYNPSHQQYRILHRSFFYDKITIGNYFYFPQRRTYSKYLGEDNDERYVPCIHLKVPDEPDRVLYYDGEFDKMKEVFLADASDE